MLSSSAAEWVALLEAVKVVIMQILVMLPFMVRVDNEGAIIMLGNITATSHTKQVDGRHKYVNEFVEDGIVKTVFVKSAENDKFL